VYFVTTPCGTLGCRCESGPSAYGPGTGVGGVKLGAAGAVAPGAAELCATGGIAASGVEVCGLGSPLAAAEFCARAASGISATIEATAKSKIRIDVRSFIMFGFTGADITPIPRPRRFSFFVAETFSEAANRHPERVEYSLSPPTGVPNEHRRL
jgi:hypothetical protein